jgi:MFS family permease
MAEETARGQQRRTFWGFVGDMFFFGAGSSFGGQTTVVPSFLATLTDSAPLIGLSSTLANGGWLIPQLFAANSLAGRARRKSSVAVPAAINRFVALLIAPAILLFAPHQRSLALVVFFVLYLAFWALDGVASIAWLDIMGRCLKPSSRARVISIGTISAGIAGIVGGAVVSIVLSSSRLSGSTGYALLFLICGIFWALSFASFLCVHESPLAVVQAPLPWPAYFRRLAGVVRGDPHLRRAVASQFLVGGLGIAAPFYVVHGLEALHFPEASIGIFTSAQLVGGILSGLVLGLLGERRGTRSVMRVWAACALGAPLIALVAELLLSPGPGAMMYVYCAVFVIVGMQGNSNMAGFLNWVLEYAPASDRPMYIGFANTLNGLSMVMPLVGGWIISATSSFVLLFIVAAALPAAGLAVLWSVPEPRKMGS